MIKVFKNFLVLSVFTIIFICAPVLAHAQGGPGDPGCDPLDPACPIDKGVILLLVIGTCYGIKKIIDITKRQILIHRV